MKRFSYHSVHDKDHDEELLDDLDDNDEVEGCPVRILIDMMESPEKEKFFLATELDQPPPPPPPSDRPSSSSLGGPSPRPSLAPKASLTVPTLNPSGNSSEELAPGEGPMPPSLHVRRCSARLLSLNVREALKQLRQKEHKARVTAVVQRNADFYRKQRCCECITMMTVLSLFTAFSLYVLFAYGFHIGKRKPFNLAQEGALNKVRGSEGETVELWCQADSDWEWCRWVHYDSFCDYEWFDSSYGVIQTSCDFPNGKVELIGNYSLHECGLRIYNITKRDRGLWMCEIEKYYFGFSRRYGELRTATFTLVVTLDSPNRTAKLPLIPTTPIPTLEPPIILSTTPNITTTEQSVNVTTESMPYPTTESNYNEEEYQKQFFLLKFFVLGGIGLVFVILAVIFWSYFMYLWRNWDVSKRPNSDQVHEEEYAAVVDGEEFFNYNDGTDLTASLQESRRKSVSFTVCTPVKEETGPDGESRLSFDISVRSVPIRNNGSRSSIGSSRSGSISNQPSPVRSTEGSDVIKVTLSPTPSAPPESSPSTRRKSNVEFGAVRRPPRRLSLAPEDAWLLSHRNASGRRPVAHVRRHSADVRQQSDPSQKPLIGIEAVREVDKPDKPNVQGPLEAGAGQFVDAPTPSVPWRRESLVKAASQGSRYETQIW